MDAELELYLYKLVLKRIDELKDAKPDSYEGVELEFLATVAESYEERHFPEFKRRQ